MTGATMMPSPNMASAWPCRCRGKASSRMAWLKGTSGAPKMPWARRNSTMLSKFHAMPHKAEDSTKPQMARSKSRRRPSQVER